jgi:hypothetical protein
MWTRAPGSPGGAGRRARASGMERPPGDDDPPGAHRTTRDAGRRAHDRPKTALGPPWGASRGLQSLAILPQRRLTFLSGSTSCRRRPQGPRPWALCLVE